MDGCIPHFFQMSDLHSIYLITHCKIFFYELCNDLNNFKILGDQSRLVLAYEHQLRRSAFCMVLGPFGGVNGRDFLCVQSLDGTLSFFEQESFAFVRFLPGFLLPGPLVFLPHTDFFLTITSNWHAETYR
jgi:Bardet-Biedl syndrome 9 protein